MGKKKQKKSLEYLLVSVIVILALFFLVNHYVFNNGYDVLNTLSTSATILVFSFIPVVWLFAFVFWLKVLVDAAQHSRWLWFSAILFVNIFALIYLFTQKPKLTLDSFRPTAWVGLGLLLLMWGVRIYPSLEYRINPVDLSTLQPTGRQFEAEVETKDLSGYTYKGPTICKEMALDDGTYYLDVSGGVVTISDNSDAKLYYRLIHSGNSDSELSSGWQEFREAELERFKYIDVAEFIGKEPSEISGPLTGCTIELWSSN